MNNKRTPSIKVQKYAWGLSQGKSKKQSALEAGFSESTALRTHNIEKTQGFKEAKKNIQTMLAKEKLTAEDILQEHTKRAFDLDRSYSSQDSNLKRVGEMIGAYNPNTNSQTQTLNITNILQLIQGD